MSSSSDSSSSSSRKPYDPSFDFDSWQETSRNTLKNSRLGAADNSRTQKDDNGNKDNNGDSNRASTSLFQHPVISMVLWLLGAKKPSNYVVETKNGGVKWRDSKGVERTLSEVLGNSSETGSVSSESDKDIISQSPQWGFYVTMTPPTQESYVKVQQQNTNTQRPSSPSYAAPKDFTGFGFAKS